MTTTPRTDIPEPLHAFIAKATIALTLADAQAEDFPLVAANAAFETLTGYGAEDVLHRNCRFLQPEGGGGPVRDRMRAFLENDSIADGRFLIPNERKSGDRFVNLLYMAKIFREGRCVMVLGSQFDASRADRNAGDLYDEVLTKDLKTIRSLSDDVGLVIAGSFETLARTHAIIAREKGGQA